MVKTGGQKPGAMAPKDVTDVVVGSIDLASHPVMVEGRTLRMRRLEVAPGGEVPWHSHADRPAIIYIVAGTVTEYASSCTVPIVHRAGDVSVEDATTQHWWKNTGDQTAVLISADLLHDPADARMM
jgi:quercetin dioxygenase-like cupin family protein